MIRKKISSSALQVALLISVVVAILLSSVILLSFVHRNLETQREKLDLNIDLVNQKIIEFSSNSANENAVRSLENNIRSTRSFWGSFSLVRVEAGTGNSAFTKAALLDDRFVDNTGLYLEDNGMPLVLVGSAKLKGDTYTPENMIKPGSIAGNYYNNSQLVFGARFYSENKLPEVDVKLRSYLKRALYSENFEEAQFSSFNNSNNSFLKDTKVIFNRASIEINEDLTGNVIVKSEKRIKVNRSAKLDQVILIAPEIIVENGVKGILHSIANKVEIKENVNLYYPSSISVLARDGNNRITDNSEGSDNLIIGKNSTVEGHIIYLNDREEIQPTRSILIKEGAVIDGFIYNEGGIDHRGLVRGNLYTKYMISKRRGSLYINHLYNGKVINVKGTGSSYDKNSVGVKKTIARWLY